MVGECLKVGAPDGLRPEGPENGPKGPGLAGTQNVSNCDRPSTGNDTQFDDVPNLRFRPPAVVTSVLVGFPIFVVRLQPF